MNRTPAILLLGLVVAVSGCASTESPELQEIQVDAAEIDINQTGPELLNSSIEKISQVESHDTTSTNQMALDASVFSLSINMTTEAASNYTSKSVKAFTDGSVTAGASYIGKNTTSFRAESYTSGNTSYVKRANQTESSGEWTQYSSGFDKHPAVLKPGLFENAEAEFLGVDKVEGNDTYVLSLEDNINSTGQHFSQVLMNYGPELSSRSEESEGVDEDNVERSQAYLWIDQETLKPVKFSYFISVKVESDGEGLFSADGSMQIKSQNTYTGYGQVQEIEVPEKAR